MYSAIPAIEGMQADWEGDKGESEKVTTLKKKQRTQYKAGRHTIVPLEVFYLLGRVFVEYQELLQHVYLMDLVSPITFQVALSQHFY